MASNTETVQELAPITPYAAAMTATSALRERDPNAAEIAPQTMYGYHRSGTIRGFENQGEKGRGPNGGKLYFYGDAFAEYLRALVGGTGPVRSGRTKVNPQVLAAHYLQEQEVTPDAGADVEPDLDGDDEPTNDGE
jgi:hypothetical protein